MPRSARSPFPTPRSRQRGFSLLIVFMLIVIMVGLAMGVVLATQQDLSVAGQDREQAQSLYAAEYAVAMAKAYLGTTPGLYAPAPSGWTGLLTSADPTVQARLCQPLPQYPNSTAPGTLPKAAPANLPSPMPGWLLPAGAPTFPVTWQYCLHNNADDPNYLDPNPAGTPTGDVSDARDRLTLLVIEAYGTGPNGATTHLAVTIAGPTGALSNPNQRRGLEGGDTTHGGVGF